MPETAAEAYKRGLDSGALHTRLDYMEKILTRLVSIEGTLTANVQTLTQARVSDAETRIATAEALKAAKDAVDDKSTRAWSPVAKTAVGVAGVLNLIALWQYLLQGK